MIAQNREEGGRLVRLAWIRWAKQQPDPKFSWLVEWDDPRFPEADREADRQIWDAIVAPYNESVVALIAENQQLRKDLDKAIEAQYRLERLLEEKDQA
ncbi:MAG TPA: hypothetical protein VHV10_04990 [Ktedonobacteraceae bacterium]|jgi:hypothetical protein|nr:hypothetical protein [Ktedonobacteraceae bacterium]